jgi:hypothetical protein
MPGSNMVKTYATVIGVVLVAVGILGFIPNPIVSSQPGALFAVNAVHNLVHLVTGAAALVIAFAITDRLQQANALIAYGVVYALVLILTIVSPTLFGLFADAPVNVADHILHLVLALGSIGVGWMARNEGATMPAPRQG